MKKVLLPLLLLLGFGWLKAPMERALHQAQSAQGFQLARLHLNTRAQLGQGGFIAALSGFRALMADLLWIRAGVAFEQTAWSRMELLLHTATQLQPRAVLFWEMAHYHMAYDAATAMRSGSNTAPTAALRRKAEMTFIKIGEAFLQEGLTFNPESSRLWERLGDLYARRLIDPARAAEAYEKAATLPKAMTYLRRFAAYEIAKAPGREAEAYRKLRALYEEGEGQRMPTLVHLLGQLEEKLAVPQAQRAYIKKTASEASEPPVVR
ncbi:MAG: hypothetical protein DVB28_000842 [Verrucomicrobia bacterium]|nr:MAG: hypothetical protein DVB28_000842 [Verrucomicrobiota bacterium]